MVDPIGIYALPESLQEIARVTNVETAVALARAYGGTRINVPKHVRADTAIVAVIGRQAAMMLVHHYAGERLEIASAKTYLRWHDARQMQSDGLSVKSIARKLGLNERSVRRLLHGAMEPHQKQPDEPDHKMCGACGHKIRRGKACHPDQSRQLALPV